jgi:hypothetical protein
VEYSEASGESDLRQAHEVQLVGVVEIDEHLHSEREQRRYACKGTQGEAMQNLKQILLYIVFENVGTRSPISLALRVRCMRAAMHPHHSHFGTGFNKRFLKKHDSAAQT